MTKTTLSRLIKAGGATLRKNGLPVDFKTGYQVSRKDCFKIDVGNVPEILGKIEQLQNSIQEDEFLGLWVDEGYIYIDISIRVEQKSEALKLGKELNQISIFDWQNKTCIYC